MAVLLKSKRTNISRLENAIIKSKNLVQITNFAIHIKEANIPRLENAIIENGEAKDIYYFARYVKGANISILEDAIVNTKDILYITCFALHVSGANISRLVDIINKSGNIEEINFISEYLKEKQKSLEDSNISTNDVNQIKATSKKKIKYID